MIRNLVWAAALMLSGMTGAQAWGASVLQCVPYARTVSGVDLYGDALNWWDQADGRFKRGHVPKKGAVLAFRAFGPMALGHVAVVSRVLDDRRILIRHANWSVPGAIEEDVLAIDVSDQGDWSQVRVWHSPTGQMGANEHQDQQARPTQQTPKRALLVGDGIVHHLRAAVGSRVHRRNVDVVWHQTHRRLTGLRLEGAGHGRTLSACLDRHRDDLEHRGAAVVARVVDRSSFHGGHANGHGVGLPGNQWSLGRLGVGVNERQRWSIP